MKCPKCGSENSPEAASCAFCRASLAAPGTVPPETGAAPCAVKPERRHLSARFPALIGAFFTLAGNGVVVLLWVTLGGNSMEAQQEFRTCWITSIIAGLTGYLLGFRIAAKPTYPKGLLLGLLGGAITGAVNVGAMMIGAVNGGNARIGWGEAFGMLIVGAGIGGTLGLICGPVMVAIVRSFRRPE